MPETAHTIGYPPQWAKAWDACRMCGTTSRPHRAKGCCAPCYAAEFRRKVKGSFRRIRYRKAANARHKRYRERMKVRLMQQIARATA